MRTDNRITTAHTGLIRPSEIYGAYVDKFY